MKVDNIAVVIPMYNSASSIIDVITGIANQTFKVRIKKIVIINDGSKDESANIVTDFAKTSTVTIELYNIPNGGVSNARNTGVMHSNGCEWIAFCDSDDVWFSNKIERQCSIIEENTTIDCLGSAYSPRPLKVGTKIISSLYKGSVKDILISNFPQPSTVLMKKSVFEEIGGFDTNQKYAEDGNFFLKVAANYNLYYLPEQLIEYGYGKRAFGINGLSSNLKGMYMGNLKNIREMYTMGYISQIFCVSMKLYHTLKYFRRLLMTKIFNN